MKEGTLITREGKIVENGISPNEKPKSFSEFLATPENKTTRRKTMNSTSEIKNLIQIFPSEQCPTFII